MKYFQVTKSKGNGHCLSAGGGGEGLLEEFFGESLVETGPCWGSKYYFVLYWWRGVT